MDKFTLVDRLVQESFRKIIDMNEQERLFVVVGGMATQIHSGDPSLYRPTNDVDLMATRKISKPEFRDEMGSSIIDRIVNAGFEGEMGKTRYGYEVVLSDGDEQFYIHVTRFSDSYWERHRDWKLREVENAQMVEVPELDGTPVLVHRVEDVMANKSRRIGKLIEEGYVSSEGRELFSYLLDADIERLSDIDIGHSLIKVSLMRKGLLYIGTDKFAENKEPLNVYKGVKDVYDLSILARSITNGKTEFDPQYLHAALSTIPTIQW